MKQHKTTLPELLDFIERFFDCSLSEAEERQLRHSIADTSLSHPAIDEARAVMGLRKPATRQRQSRNFHRTLRIAATVAVLLAIGAYLFITPSSGNFGNNKCIAYTNGRCITDEEAVLNLLREDLREFDDAVEDSDRSFAVELSDIAAFIETYESPI